MGLDLALALDQPRQPRALTLAARGFNPTLFWGGEQTWHSPRALGRMDDL